MIASGRKTLPGIPARAGLEVITTTMGWQAGQRYTRPLGSLGPAAAWPVDSRRPNKGRNVRNVRRIARCCCHSFGRNAVSRWVRAGGSGEQRERRPVGASQDREMPVVESEHPVGAMQAGEDDD